MVEGEPVDRGPVFWQLNLYEHLQRHYPKPKPYATEVARRGPWKLMARGSNPLALYNLERDLREEQNVLEEHPKVAADLKQALKQFLDAPRNNSWR